MASPHVLSGVPSGRPTPVRATSATRRAIARERDLDPSFADYLQQIEHYSLLDAAGERLLGHLLNAGRPTNGGEGPLTFAAHAAREGLITSNLRLVIVIAARYADPHIPLLDIVSAGNIGLIRAVDKYIPGRARFGTHAAWWIRQACSYYVMTQGPLIHIPREVRQSSSRLDRAQNSAAAIGEQLDTSELFARANVETKLSARIEQAQITVSSLDEPILSPHDDSDTMTIADTIADTTSEPVEQLVVKDDVISDLHRKLATVLTTKERQVLTLRFGLGELDGAVSSLEDTAIALHTSRARIRALEQAALSKLRTAYNADEHPEQVYQALLFRAV